jgi:Fe-S-cluster containining protein
MAREKAYDTAKIHLQVLGQDRELEFPVRVGQTAVVELIGAARELTERLVAASVEHAEAQGKKVSCGPGCGACCRQLVPISSVEAVALADAVTALPPERRDAIRKRFKAAVARLEQVGLVDKKVRRGRSALVSTAAPGESTWENVSRRYFAAQIPCPILEDESCSLYADRPLVCREYLVTTPAAWCSELSDQPQTTARPARMGEVLSDAANAVTGKKTPLLPLTLALEWAEAHGAPLRQEKDGEELFWTLMNELQAADGG